MRYIRDASNSNFIVGIFLLIVLAVFAGPNALPRVLSNLIPLADEGVPCERLALAFDRDRHQSLLGRAASTIPGNPPMSIRVLPTPIPASPNDNWLIRIVLTNDSIGTIPVVINPTASIGDNGQNGIGLVFNTNPVGAGGGTSAASSIRLLGPRQRCVQRVSIPVSQLGSLGATNTIKAYYRNATQGFGGSVGAIYPDWGMWIGVVESDNTVLTFNAGT